MAFRYAPRAVRSGFSMSPCLIFGRFSSSIPFRWNRRGTAYRFITSSMMSRKVPRATANRSVLSLDRANDPTFS